MVERPPMTLVLEPDKIPTTWDLLDVRHGMIGQVVLPMGVRPLALANRTIVGLGEGQHGEPVVYRYTYESP
jgi:hypothetical protein